MATILSTAFQQPIADIAHGHKVPRGDSAYLHATEKHFLRASLNMRFSNDVGLADIRIAELYPYCRPTGTLALHQAPGSMRAGSVQEGSHSARVHVSLLIAVCREIGHGQAHTAGAV